MDVSRFGVQVRRLAAAVPARRAAVGGGQITPICHEIARSGGRLVALWASDERDRAGGFLVRVALQDDEGLLLLEHLLPDERAECADLTPIFPAANRMQRAAFDLVGVRFAAEDQRPWLWQAAWPIDRFPLRRDFEALPAWQPGEEDYAFVRVTGDGVHEIPVGPVHAGIIEPGHFRFQVVGEKVLRLEERLAYVHKGIEKRFESLPIVEAHRLAGRISGDTTVAYAWAYAQALESLAEIEVPTRAAWQRGLALERERLANHLGDLGYLGNDGGFAFALAQFSRLKEEVLRTNLDAFGHRLAMDFVIPGGVAHDVPRDARAAMREELPRLEREIRRLRSIFDEHAGLQDRFRACGRVSPALARQLGLTGLAGRASGQAFDLRLDFPTAPYSALDLRSCGYEEGDVASRVAVRFDEALESLRLCGELLERLPAGPPAALLPPIGADRLGVGCVEGWRGPVLVALESGPKASVRRCHAHDPSWQNWPVLEHAIIGNIVPDFPLINKSFNLSYSGHDL